MNPIVDPTTGKRLRSRTSANKNGKKDRWRNKKALRVDNFWKSLDAN